MTRAPSRQAATVAATRALDIPAVTAKGDSSGRRSNVSRER